MSSVLSRSIVEPRWALTVGREREMTSSYANEDHEAATDGGYDLIVDCEDTEDEKRPWLGTDGETGTCDGRRAHTLDNRAHLEDQVYDCDDDRRLASAGKTSERGVAARDLARLWLE